MFKEKESGSAESEGGSEYKRANFHFSEGPLLNSGAVWRTILKQLL